MPTLTETRSCKNVLTHTLMKQGSVVTLESCKPGNSGQTLIRAWARSWYNCVKASGSFSRVRHQACQLHSIHSADCQDKLGGQAHADDTSAKSFSSKGLHHLSSSATMSCSGPVHPAKSATVSGDVFSPR
jgi:hypothetical protein